MSKDQLHPRNFTSFLLPFNCISRLLDYLFCEFRFRQISSFRSPLQIYCLDFSSTKIFNNLAAVTWFGICKVKPKSKVTWWEKTFYSFPSVFFSRSLATSRNICVFQRSNCHVLPTRAANQCGTHRLGNCELNLITCIPSETVVLSRIKSICLNSQFIIKIKLICEIIMDCYSTRQNHCFRCEIFLILIGSFSIFPHSQQF